MNIWFSQHPFPCLPCFPPLYLSHFAQNHICCYTVCALNNYFIGFLGHGCMKDSSTALFNGWCLVFTAARKEGRYREPPPTPPGYIGIPITDFPEGHSHPTRKPPDYNVALQRSRMVARPSEAAGPSPAPQPQTHPGAGRPVNKPQWHKPNECDPRLAPYQSQGFSTEEDGTYSFLKP